MADTVRLQEPLVDPDAAASVNVLLPLPGDAILVGANVAVTPLGKPLTDNATCEWNPFNTAVDSVIGVEPPGATVTLVALGVSVKVGVNTDTLSIWVIVTPPPAAANVRLK